MHTRSVTLWLLGSAALAMLAAAACGSVDDRGSAADHRGGQVALARPNLRDTLDTVIEVPAGYVHVPGGMVFHRDCVHEIPDGAQVDDDLNVTLNGARIAQFSPCEYKPYRHVGPQLRPLGPDIPPPTTTGWVEDSFSNSDQAMFTAMNPGKWVVPAPPTRDDGQIIYLFPSLMSATTILQPVLQWGSSDAGGGSYWAMANWVVKRGSTPIHGTATRVNPGDRISASMVMTGLSANATAWNITWTDETTGATANNSFVTPDGELMNSAQGGVLEVVRLANCSDFPATGFTQFGSPFLWEGNDYTGRKPINPSWSIVDPIGNDWTGPACGYTVTVNSFGATQLYY